MPVFASPGLFTGQPPGLRLSTPYYLLADLNTGQVLVEKGADVLRPPASTTKVMTALMVLEQDALADIVTVSERAERTYGSGIWLEAGEHHTVRDLLHALMLESANDAATALAEHFGGTEAEFARSMTRRAAELGATNTLFRTASGLDSRWGILEHASTARDLVTIVRHAMARPDFRDLVATTEYNMGERELHNGNYFLFDYPGAIGIKNGWTPRAGNTLITAARRGNVELVAALLAAPGRDALYTDAERLMDYGFTAFEYYDLIPEGQPLSAVYIPGVGDPILAVAGRGAGFHVPIGAQLPNLERRLEFWPGLAGPVGAGARLGQVVLTFGGQRVAQVPLQAQTADDFRATAVPR